jgi:glycosyltransferase involved in cell wall biosynthesis
LGWGYDLVTRLRRYRLEGRADVSGPESSLDRPLPDEQLNRRYNLFDVTMPPSGGEGFGLPIIESLAAGVRVVATDCSTGSGLVGGRGELERVLTTVTVGTNLIEHAVIDVDDLAARIAKLQDEPALVKQYSEAGLAFARSLSWAALMPQWLEVIRSVGG